MTDPANSTSWDLYDRLAKHRLRWRRKNRHYYRLLEHYLSAIIPRGSTVLEIGCGIGDLLAALQPARGVGIDFSPEMIHFARRRFPQLHFEVQDAHELEVQPPLDYILLSDTLGSLQDIQTVLQRVCALCSHRTRVVITNYNYLWQPMLRMAERLGLKQPEAIQNWLSLHDIAAFLALEELQVIRQERRILLPKYIPLLDVVFNRILANLPLLNRLCLVQITVARSMRPMAMEREMSVSVVIPARNEKGNIENAVRRMPAFGRCQEMIFVEGHSADGTYDEMLRVQTLYPQHTIRVLQQGGRGKGNAVREGFAAATGEVLMILDADLTVPPEDLPKFYRALQQNRGELINGNRLIYPMETQAMRTLNLLGNKFFGLLFSWLLGQRLKDTLCGTKVLLREDYISIRNQRAFFGDFDPFGDFDLLFGAAHLNLRIVDLPVRYRQRRYGETQIRRFAHGWLLLRMSIFAARKLKFI